LGEEEEEYRVGEESDTGDGKTERLLYECEWLSVV
jgi:hypothetical protein